MAAGLACAVGTYFLVAWLTARQNSSLHRYFPEVLQLTVNVKVSDTAVEAGAVLSRGLAQRCHVIFPRHA